MNIAVLTLTRDRLPYTKHCLTALRAEAGCDYDHFVLDQGSTDGTREWLTEQFDDGRLTSICLGEFNVGISRGMNALLGAIADQDYDVVVKFDNDCELTQPNTLRDIAQLTLDGGALLSPRILGLQNPPQSRGELRIGTEIISDIPQIGGIFLSAPAWVYDEFRFNDGNPYWGMDDVEICAWFRAKGGTCGYVNRLEAWHYMGTDAQQADQPAYFERKFAEMGAS